MAPRSRLGQQTQTWPICVFHAVTNEWFRHGHMLHFEPLGINGLFSFTVLSDGAFLLLGLNWVSIKKSPDVTCGPGTESEA